MTSSAIEDSWRWMTEGSAEDLSARAEEVFSGLGHADWRARRAAAALLARTGRSEAVVERLLDAVVADEIARRNAAIEALREMGARATDAVLARLERTQGAARRFLLEAMMEASTERVAASVAPLLDDADANVAHAAVELLGVTPGTAAREALVEALSKADPVLRIAALQAFEVRVEEAPWPAVIARLAEGACARTALRVLAAARAPEAAAALAAALEDPRLAVRREALIRAVWRLRMPPDAVFVKALWSALNARREVICASLDAVTDASSEAEVRGAGLWLVSALGAPARALDALEAGDPSLTEWVDSALDLLAHHDFDALLDAAISRGGAVVKAVVGRARESLSEAQRAAVVRAAWSDLGAVSSWFLLARYGASEDLDGVMARVEGLWSAQGDACDQVLSTLAARLPEAIERLCEGLSEGEQGMARAELLSRCGAMVPEALLTRGLTDARPELRAMALRVMGLDARWSAASIAGALADPAPAVRLAAATALFRKGSDGHDALRGAFDHDDPAVVLVALLAVGEQLSASALERLTEHASPEVVAESLARLRDASPETYRARARALLTHDDWRVRAEAVRALAGDPASSEVLEARWTSERDPFVLDALSEVFRTDRR